MPRIAGRSCALALTWPDGHSEIFEGTVDGTLVWPPRGDRFGYDPMFRQRRQWHARRDRSDGKSMPRVHRCRVPQVDRRLFSGSLTRTAGCSPISALSCRNPRRSIHRAASAFMCTGRSAFPNVRTATLIRTLLTALPMTLGGPACWLSWIIMDRNKRPATGYGFLRWRDAVSDAACYSAATILEALSVYRPLLPISKSR